MSSSYTAGGLSGHLVFHDCKGQKVKAMDMLKLKNSAKGQQGQFRRWRWQWYSWKYLWVSPFLSQFTRAQQLHDILGPLGHSILYPCVMAEFLHPQVQWTDDGFGCTTTPQIYFSFVFVELWMLTLAELCLSVTNDIIVVEAELAGLAGFEDLHSDELDLGFAVLKHLLCCCKQFSVLQGQQQA